MTHELPDASSCIECSTHGTSEATAVCRHLARSLEDNKARGFHWTRDGDGMIQAFCDLCWNASDEKWAELKEESCSVICLECLKRVAAANGAELALDQPRATGGNLITNEHAISRYIHCSLCVKEVKEGTADTSGPVSLRDYQELEVGWTKAGLQIWCKRHDANVLHLDFEGRRLPSNATRKKKPNELS